MKIQIFKNAIISIIPRHHRTILYWGTPYYVEFPTIKTIVFYSQYKKYHFAGLNVCNEYDYLLRFPHIEEDGHICLAWNNSISFYDPDLELLNKRVIDYFFQSDNLDHFNHSPTTDRNFTTSLLTGKIEVSNEKIAIWEEDGRIFVDH